MTQNRGRGLGDQPIPPHKIQGDSTLSSRVDTMIDNARGMGGKPRGAAPLPPDRPARAAADNTRVTPTPPAPHVRPGLGEAGRRTAKEFDDDRRALAAHADSVLKGKRKS